MTTTQGYVAKHNLNIYGSKRIDLPSPNYIVFYNGTKEESDSKVLYLSDSFIKNDGEEACLECTATMLNINFGHNRQLMEACHELYEYSYLIEQIRIGTRSGLNFPDAIDQAVENCIVQHILESFLKQYRAEVTNMIPKEFNLEEHIQSEKAYSLAEGQTMGENKFARLTQHLISASRTEDLLKATTDYDYRNLLYSEYNIE